MENNGAARITLEKWAGKLSLPRICELAGVSLTEREFQRIVRDFGLRGPKRGVS